MEQMVIISISVFSACLAVAVAALGASIGNAKVTSKAVEGVARQPEAKNAILVTMLISVGLIEALPIIAAVIAIVLVLANPFVK